MTPTQFKDARRKLGLSASQLGIILDTNERTIRVWESEAPKPGRDKLVGPNPIACQVMRWMLSGWRPPEWPERGASRQDAPPAHWRALADTE